VDYDELVALALELPETEESMSYGTPSIKRKGRFMFRLKEDGESAAVKLDWDTHDKLLAERPDLYFKTPHYEGYPAFLVKLEALEKREAKALIRASWESAPKPAKKPSR
jgi:hypothetical protein